MVLATLKELPEVFSHGCELAEPVGILQEGFFLGENALSYGHHMTLWFVAAVLACLCSLTIRHPGVKTLPLLVIQPGGDIEATL